MVIGHAAIWAICALSIGGVMTRAFGVGEWIYALGGASALIALRLISIPAALAAVARGTDVYLFLTGMMLLAELARRHGVFDWLAGHAVNAARGSRLRLFALVYGVGIVVTTVLSNDATAVVLTPAVAASVRAAEATALPYVLACAFIANAASFVLPISNPANLVVFGGGLPPLGRWLAVFGLPSMLAIAATFGALALATRRDLRGPLARRVDVPPLRLDAGLALGGIGLAAAALVVASAFGAPLGLTTCIAGVAVFVVVGVRDPHAAGDVVREVAWPVLALVAGLFVLVEGLETSGLLDLARNAMLALVQWPPWLAVLGAGGLTAAASNAINNLPAGLLASASIAPLHAQDALRGAVAIGIDLGPNLSVTGSLATVLWLIALRRDGLAVGGWSFLRIGLVVMPPALVLALESLVIGAR